MQKYSREPLIHFAKRTPAWISNAGFLLYGIRLHKALDIESYAIVNCFKGRIDFRQKDVFQRHHFDKKVNLVIPDINLDETMELYNNYSIEKICRFTNVNIVIHTRIHSMVRTLYEFGNNKHNETVHFHITQSNFRKKDWSKLSLIYNKQVKFLISVVFKHLSVKGVLGTISTFFYGVSGLFHKTNSAQS